MDNSICSFNLDELDVFNNEWELCYEQDNLREYENKLDSKFHLLVYTTIIYRNGHRNAVFLKILQNKKPILTIKKEGAFAIKRKGV